MRENNPETKSGERKKREAEVLGENEGRRVWRGWTSILVLVRLVSRPVLDPSAFEFCFDVFWDTTFHADGVHPSDVFRCMGTRTFGVESVLVEYAYMMEYVV